MFSTASSRHPQLLHNITNWDKDRTTEPCLHAPAVSLTLILPIDYCSSIFTNVLTTFNILAGIIAALTFIYFIYCFYPFFICVGCGLSTSINDFNNNNNLHQGGYLVGCFDCLSVNKITQKVFHGILWEVGFWTRNSRLDCAFWPRSRNIISCSSVCST